MSIDWNKAAQAELCEHFTIRLHKGHMAELDKLARKKKVTRSWIVREVIADFLESERRSGRK